MDPKFQTSFIPKQSLADQTVYHAPRGISLLSLGSFVIFITMALAAGGIYFYKSSLDTSIGAINGRLASIKSDLDPGLIQKMQMMSERIQSAKTIVARHQALSYFFTFLEGSTLRGISFKSFDYNEGDKGELIVNIKGEASSFYSIALESDVLNDSSYIKHPVFSDFILNEQGRVLFSLVFTIDPASFLYASSISASATAPEAEAAPSQ